MASQMKAFSGAQLAKASPRVVSARRTLAPAPKAAFIGSANNLIMVASTTACLVAGRFGLAPTVNKSASAGLKLSEVDSGIKSADPAGFTVVDCLALGTFGHVIGCGIILGLKNTGAL
eukprot:jgi/Ulvmu1/5919/UM026_0041.1